MSNATGGTIIDEVVAKAKQGRVALSPAKAIELAGRLYTEGRYGQTESVCRQIIQQNPAHADAHNILGVALNAQGKTKEAVATLKRAIKLAPRASSFYANLGEIERQRGNLTEARIAFVQAIELDPKNAKPKG